MDNEKETVSLIDELKFLTGIYTDDKSLLLSTISNIGRTTKPRLPVSKALAGSIESIFNEKKEAKF